MYRHLLKPMAKDAWKFVLDTLFPIRCLVCGTEGFFICLFCRTQLKHLPEQFCIACHKPSLDGLTHPRCQTPYEADGLISIYDYHDEAVSNIIIKGKYDILPGAYEILGLMLADTLRSNFKFLLQPDEHDDLPLLVPVPLSKKRLRWRGFNQSEIICQAISKELGLPACNALVRIKNTKTQKDLKKEQRIKNVKDAFALKPGTDVHYQKIILVDDVTTTGSTLHEAALVLKRNGAYAVWCLTVARD